MTGLCKVGIRLIVVGYILGCVVFGPNVFADDVINDDLIVTGGLAVGVDAQDGESFNYITVRLHENNTRLLFDDSSTLPGYSANDWIIEANDSVSGGQNYFGIKDAGVGDPTNDSGTLVFRIDAGAPANTIRAYQNGDVSLGGANVANTISVGSVGLEGTITNVAPGVNGTDAVNVNQLNTVSSNVSTNTTNITTNTQNIATNSKNIATNTSNISQNRGLINRNAGNIAHNRSMINTNASHIVENRAMIGQNAADISGIQQSLSVLDSKAMDGIAAAAAINMMLTPSAPGKTTVSVGTGAYEDSYALGVNIAHYLDLNNPGINVILAGGVAMAGEGNTVYRLGGGLEF